MIESNKKYVIGLDFGTDSCRALIVDVRNGDEVATGVSFYPRWKTGLYCDAQSNQYRQHPLDYIESMTEAVHVALSHLTEEEIASICGLCFDTTGSTPALTDCNGMPLALNPEFAEEPDAGLCEMTFPCATELSYAYSFDTVNPCAVSVLSAFSAVLPVTEGTSMLPLPLLITTVIVV